MVQEVTTYELFVVAVDVGTAMEGVGTTLSNGIDSTTGETALTNVKGSDVDLNLLNAFHRNRLSVGLAAVTTIVGKTESVVVHYTINLESVVTGICTGKRHRTHLLI